MESEPLILLTGATGYVGGRLLRALENGRYRLRCVARHPEYLTPHVAPTTEVVKGDCLSQSSLEPAMSGVHTAYYLVHSMASAVYFEEKDRQAARNFAAAAEAAGVHRIIYLGGLGDPQSNLSPHLRSRQEVGAILRSYRVPVTEFRASVVIGSGSLSFEMIRALVERLPVMICPRWVAVPTQPIAIEDLITYLSAAMVLPIKESYIFEIGGPDRVSYGDIMREYASQRGLHRLMIVVPVLTPRLSSLWLGLVTPIYARVGRKLIDSIQNPTIVNDPSALSTFPIKPMALRASIERALKNEDQEIAQTRWSDALSACGSQRQWGGAHFGTRIVDSCTAEVDVQPEVAFRPILIIGGKTGWYYANWMWQVRGAIDLLLGGVGMRRGRRDPECLSPGDTVDFWRVEDFENNRKLRLMAEMKLPGRAWLEFEVQPSESGAIIRQTAIFDPLGILGLVYWYLLYPLHRLIFSGMLRGIVGRCQRLKEGHHDSPHSEATSDHKINREACNPK